MIDWSDKDQVARWLKTERTRREWSQGEVATRLSALFRSRIGGNKDFKYQSIQQIETAALKSVPDWAPLLDAVFDGPATAATSLDDIASEHGLVFLEEIDLPLGMGASFLDGHPEVLGVVPFKADWLHGLHEGPLDRLKVTRGRGDSMQPTIMDGDIVLVDTAHRRIDDQDRIWAVAYGDLGMIRRIRVTPRGTWLLMPDNSVVRPDEVGDGEVHVIGRVIWIGRRM
jgi:phage repressor protein C with HTH and peptisase S24 domain